MGKISDVFYGKWRNVGEKLRNLTLRPRKYKLGVRKPCTPPNNAHPARFFLFGG